MEDDFIQFQIKRLKQGAHYMEKNSYKKLLVYLKRFVENYNYFSSSHAGKNLTLYLDQFIRDQVKAAQALYGDQGAEMVKELAEKLTARH